MSGSSKDAPVRWSLAEEDFRAREGTITLRKKTSGSEVSLGTFMAGTEHGLHQVFRKACVRHNVAGQHDGRRVSQGEPNQFFFSATATQQTALNGLKGPINQFPETAILVQTPVNCATRQGVGNQEFCLNAGTPHREIGAQVREFPPASRVRTRNRTLQNTGATNRKPGLGER